MTARYDRKFFGDLRSGSYQSAGIVVPLLVDIFRPRSVIDIGCGVGTWLKAFSELGVADINGVDGEYALDAGLEIPAKCFRTADLSAPLNCDRKYDLALSLEVAEHLPAQSGVTLVDSLCQCADVVVFAAAIPFQGGTHHINCQWQSYWASLFHERGFACYDIVRPAIWGNDGVKFWYQQNMIVYIRSSSSAAAGRVPTRREALDIVHPRLYLSPGFSWGRAKALLSKVQKKLTASLRSILSHR